MSIYPSERHQKLQDTIRFMHTHPKKRNLFQRWRSFINWWESTKVEKGLDQLAHDLENLGIVKLLEIAGSISLIIVFVTYIGSEKHRRDSEVMAAWQTITSATGQSGSGGRILALEFLNASPGANWRRKFPWFCAPHPACTWESQSLAAVNLGAEEPGAYLVEIQLPGAFLRGANLQGAILRGANLQDATLFNANLQGAILRGAQLQGAQLQGAYLAKTNLKDAKVSAEQLDQAHLCQTILPAKISLDPDRDCQMDWQPMALENQ
ncbi:MAG: pentapeptide repeat-containing protein [Prochlorotrichaceae cyanobacterium]